MYLNRACVLSAVSRGACVSGGLLSILLAAGTAKAQWSVTRLHPTGATASYATGSASGQQAGFSMFDDNRSVPRAGVWSGSAESWVDLSPTGSVQSLANATDGVHQVGYAGWAGGGVRASLWSGSPGSWVDLNPAGADESFAFGVSGIHQVGEAHIHSEASRHASLWSGSAGSWVDLNPGGASSSSARAVRDGQQVGFARVGGAYRASLWTGTASSWVDLHPVGATESWATGVYAGQQVGYTITGDVTHGALWNGSAESWTDLNPADAASSGVLDCFAGMQAGSAQVGGVGRASFWSGTADSWVDLHDVLPSGYQASVATGIWSDANSIYVSGYGVIDWNLDQTEAFLWTRPIPAPGASAFVGMSLVMACRRLRGGHRFARDEGSSKVSPAAAESVR